MNDKPNMEGFKTEIINMISDARNRGEKYIDIISRDVHFRVGGYPSANHQMPTCCDAMYFLMNPQDEIIDAPPKNRGATLKIRYKF